jgi:hypothetical protein
VIRIGIIGLDSTHALDFTRILNTGKSNHAVRVVAACAGEPTDFPLSTTRRAAIERQIRDDFALRIVSSPEALMAEVDAFLVLSCDGRCHAREVRRLLPARKPIFIDKPLSANWREAADLLRAANSAGTPCFSASALRYRPGIAAAKRFAHEGPVKIESVVPALVESGHPDLSWHGTHGVESVYSLLGAGCQTVKREVTNGHDRTTGIWPDGSQAAIVRVTDDTGKNFLTVIRSDSGSKTMNGHTYDVVHFFQTGISPVSPREMIEVLAFIAAADESRDAGGATIDLSAMLADEEFLSTRPVRNSPSSR